VSRGLFSALNDYHIPTWSGLGMTKEKMVEKTEEAEEAEKGW
jgi:hypothetical protein